MIGWNLSRTCRGTAVGWAGTCGMSDPWQIWEREALSKIRTKQKRHNNWRTFFVIGYGSFLQKAKIPNLLCKLKKQYNLSWLWVSLAYRMFLNIQENFSGDLSGKVIADVTSQDFCWQPCNYSSQSKIGGLCAYNGKCQAKCIVDGVTCHCCG